MLARTPDRRQRRDRDGAGSEGFTLVELLVVIAIIGLLVSIILPSLNTARTIARTTKSQALLKVIGTDLEMFHDDAVVGRDQYPPSTWDTSSGGDPYGTGNGSYTANGAETLVWALSGADMLGTPGFRAPLHHGTDGAYELSGGNPVQPRSGPFMDPTSTEMEQRALTGRTSWLYIDAFNTPVLYYRAASGTPNINTTYNRDDNEDIVPATDALAQAATATINGVSIDQEFKRFIHNPRITVACHPQNSDSFLLITAGPDQQYGTADDVTNFPLAGENFP